MISVSSAQLNAFLAGFIWPLSRILALIASAPLLGNAAFPARVKIGLGVLVTVLVAPLAGPMPEVEPWSAPGLVVLAQQVLIGLAMGLAMRVVFLVLDMAGELAGLQMGLGFATFFDPQNATSSPVVAQFLGMVASLAFLAMNGHLLMISVLAESFSILPVSAEPLGAGAWLTLATWGGHIFFAGLMLSLPVVAALLIANLALGILTRAAPQLNVFAVGFPVTLLIGFAMLGLLLPYLSPALERLMQDGLGMMRNVAQQAALH